MDELDFNSVNVFGNKSLADVFKDIYSNTKKKDKIIDDLIADLKPMVKTVSDAMQLIPYIKDYLDVGVKNNEHLIKMAAVVQRSMQVNKTATSYNVDSDFIISDAERDALLKSVSETSDFKAVPIISKTEIKSNDQADIEPPIIQ